MNPNKPFWNQYIETREIIIAKIIPLIPPINVSFKTIFTAFDGVNSLTARALTETVNVCVPALPPIEATIGINTASATTFSIDAWKKLITIEATTAVNKFKNNKENLDFVVFIKAL